MTKEAVHEGTPSGLLRIGTGESTAACLPGPLSEFHRRYPQVTLSAERTGGN
jgi:DNA-binding transcriptional LysR family regulator